MGNSLRDEWKKVCKGICDQEVMRERNSCVDIQATTDFITFKWI
jgi:hypothetical protein